MEKGNGRVLSEFLDDYVRRHGIDALSLVSSKELPIFEKYDGYVPADLLRYAYSVDKLNVAEAEKRIRDIYAQYTCENDR
jgi:hypothetical protein